MRKNKKSKIKNDGKIPNAILNQVNEYCAGGFVCFYFNSKDGKPECGMTFDSPAHCLALQKYIYDWSMALEEINIQDAENNIKRAIAEPENPEDENIT